MLKRTIAGIIFAPSGLDAGAQVGLADVSEFCRITGASEAQARAVIAVESAGRGFTTSGGQRVPKILLEAHKVYQFSGALPLSRVAPHLSSRRWNRRLYNVSRIAPLPGEDLQHRRLRELVQVGERLEAQGFTDAEAICREAGLLSCSWGLGQVMGFHWRSLGFDSLQEFVNVNYQSEGAQIGVMARFVKANGLSDDVRRGGRSAASWRGFARGYNGSGYHVHNYHGKLARAYRNAGGR